MRKIKVLKNVFVFLKENKIYMFKSS